MLLAIDIGNSAIKFGLFEGETLTSKFSIPTKRNATVDEISLAVGDRLDRSVDAAIVCSVVPETEKSIREFVCAVANVEPTFVDNSFDFGLKINYEPIESLGTDRLINAFAAVEKYGAPCIVCSLGTATTIDVVTADRAFLGGVIAPGMDAMGEALHMKAPRLPKMSVTEPESILGKTTEESIRSGVYYGYVAMVEGLISRIRTEAGVSRVVASGGNAEQTLSAVGGIAVVDQDLVLKGLRRLHARS